MICNTCAYKNECDWLQSLNRIKNEIVLGIGMDDQLGKDLMETINDFDMRECEYYEERLKERGTDE